MRFRISLVALLFALLMSSGLALSQAANDPLVGSWNIKSDVPFVSVMIFNAGGTTAEFDSSGTNSSASPGESISLGRWRKNANGSYFLKEENYVYDSTGALSLVAVTTATLTLGATSNTFTGAGLTNFYLCSVSTCPGPFFAGPFSFNMTGRRF